ncbi:Fic/DOC family N-terminal domain-containing protein [Komagataeibacter melaceti]|uniref:Fic/DOC family N-terminal domain-containing protein n=1 Tax=Komagataeibacter melaceti TaxID=2766577 RepID=UPI00308431CE
MPPPPPDGSLVLGAVGARHGAAQAALGEITALARTLPDPYLISRVLGRREAVSSSALEGTHSTLSELLVVDEDDHGATQAVRQVRDYARALEHFLPRAAESGRDLFRRDLVQALHRAVVAHDPGYRDVPGRLRQGSCHVNCSVLSNALP